VWLANVRSIYRYTCRPCKNYKELLQTGLLLVQSACRASIFSMGPWRISASCVPLLDETLYAVVVYSDTNFSKNPTNAKLFIIASAF
jgi:hypothetical protein